VYVRISANTYYENQQNYAWVLFMEYDNATNWLIYLDRTACCLVFDRIWDLKSMMKDNVRFCFGMPHWTEKTLRTQFIMYNWVDISTVHLSPPLAVLSPTIVEPNTSLLSPFFFKQKGNSCFLAFRNHGFHFPHCSIALCCLDYFSVQQLLDSWV